ncbi:phosphatidylserine/phosphatidylglycerophosphate/cardiolipin synthase family protein [Candidatus Riflebacteria bacterium]
MKFLMVLVFLICFSFPAPDYGNELEENLIRELYSQKAQIRPDEVLCSVKNYLDKNESSRGYDRLTFELAAAYERLLGDRGQSLELYRKIVTRKNSLYAGLARKQIKSVFHTGKGNPNPFSLEDTFAKIQPRNDLPLTPIKRLSLNSHAWFARWKLISEAKKSIVFSSFLMTDDIFGFSLLGLLQKKAAEGIPVHFLLDGGNYTITHLFKGEDIFEELASNPNCKMVLYQKFTTHFPKMLKNFGYFLKNTHDKILVVDDHFAIMGGRNIGKEYFIKQGSEDRVHRDCDVFMQGKFICKELKKAFYEEFNRPKNKIIQKDKINLKSPKNFLQLSWKMMDNFLHHREPPDFSEEKLSKKERKLLQSWKGEMEHYSNLKKFHEFNLEENLRQLPVKIIDQHSIVGTRDDIRGNLISFIDGAKKEIIIQSLWVLLTDWAYAALKRASQRGVDILIHTNGATSTNYNLSFAFLVKDWVQLKKDMPTLRLFIGKGPRSYLHGKVYIFDSTITLIGSYNLDPLSDWVNSEITSVTKDEEFATETRTRILKDIETLTHEYILKTHPDGSTEVIFGPEQHFDEKTLKKLEFISRFEWLRKYL